MVVVLAMELARSAAADPCTQQLGGFGDGLTRDHALRERLRGTGVEVGALYAGEVFAADGLDTPVRIAGLAVLSVDLELSTLAHDWLGTMHVAGLAIHGDGPSAELMDIYGSSGNLAEPDVRLFEAWIEQPIGPFALRAGLLAADQEFVLAEHSTSLVNATFGIISLFSYNIVGPVYPIATPGASARLETEHVTARAAIYDGTQANRNGIPTALAEHALVLGELGVAFAKLGGWHHGERGRGAYVVLDRHVSGPLGLFGRASVAEGPVSQYVDLGLRVGPLRGRDFASGGFAFVETDTGEQTLVELTYQLRLAGWLTLQPDLQFLQQRERSTVLVGTRMTIAL